MQSFQMFLNAAGLSVGLLGLLAVGPTVSIVLLVRRKRRAHALRRSPLTEQLLRSPGHSLRIALEELDEKFDEFLMQVMFSPVLLVAVGLGMVLTNGPSTAWPTIVMTAVVALAMIGHGTWRMLQAATRRDDLRKGYDAELAVGQQLDQLMRQGAHVFHDVPAGLFNVDHVVISPAGIFAVETKGYAKPRRGEGFGDAKVVFDGKVLQFPTWATTEPVEQAARQATWLASELKPVLEHPVEPVAVLALPGWFVERTGKGPVRVYSGKELPYLVRSRKTAPLSTRDIDRAVHLMNQRCRTVGALYAP